MCFNIRFCCASPHRCYSASPPPLHRGTDVQTSNGESDGFPRDSSSENTWQILSSAGPIAGPHDCRRRLSWRRCSILLPRAARGVASAGALLRGKRLRSFSNEERLGVSNPCSQKRIPYKETCALKMRNGSSMILGNGKLCLGMAKVSVESSLEVVNSCQHTRV